MFDSKLLVPESLKNTVVRIWKQDGAEWLLRLPELIRTYVCSWSLTELEPMDEMSVSYVACAMSPHYGPVVLKIGFPHAELAMSLEALILYDGKHCCRLLEYHRGDCVMLMERVRPGSSLRNEPDWKVRITVAATMARCLPVSVQYGILPEYGELLASQLKAILAHPGPQDGPYDLVAVAERLYAGIHDGSRRRMLLHGDLHHGNILLSEKGWMAVDPQGWAGEAVLEAGRFFQHEWMFHPSATVWSSMDYLVRIFAEALCEDERTVAASCFLNNMRTVCWASNNPERKGVLNENLERMNLLMERYEL